MAIDVNNLTQIQLLRLMNATPLGNVLSHNQLRWQMNTAAYRIGDGKHINLVRYISWLAKEYEKPKPQKQSIEDSRLKDLLSKNAARKASQDIGEIPAVENPERRERACGDFRFFCETYFADVFYLTWSDDHLKVISKIEQSVLHGGLFAFAMPRGSGKSALTRSAAIWAILIGARKYVCLIGSATRQSLNLFQSVQAAMLGNDLLLADFPEIIYPIQCLENSAHKQRGQRYNGQLTYPVWGTHKIVIPTIAGSCASGSVITVDSLDSNIRGQIHTTMDGRIIRPDLVLVDDPQTRESAKSVDQTNQRISTLNGDVLGMAGPGKKMSGLLTCTKIYCNDLADQLLDSEKNPEWQGQCTKMVYAFPTDTKLWDQYEQIRADSLRAGNGGKEATEFYIENRNAMDAGSKVAWDQRHNEDDVSAIQHAMNLMLRDEVAFFAEYQNDPIAEQSDEQVLTPEQVLEKANGRKRGEVPLSCQYLTMFIDVHDKLLFYTVCAWSEDFTGYVVDYGTYPDQKRLSFTLRKAQITLQNIYPDMEKEGAIQAGMEDLCRDYLSRDFSRGTGAMKIDRCLIDGGYMPGIVENIRHKFGGNIMASKGVGIRAASKPMSTYKRKPGERHGHHWYIPNINKTGEFQHVAIDTNYWKTFVHERFFVAAGDHGSMTLFGKGGHHHALFAEHVAGSETWVRTEGHGRTVYQWSPRIGGIDNHWLDCIVGCSVAASMCGCTLTGHSVKSVSKRERIKLSDIQNRRQ
ncbi:MAG: hypothetical protein UV78_C0046G0007 [Parcubacteria group bacterium GW2011_GWA2_43_17]|nr:MAG: hypothetical protein UV78_C0046G0007 [Parcubacteria group bacterium GW2011_GWA2_43_17]OHB44493.1 MAG: hypothetical protein A2Y13_04925 [Planctomycetes bacterium GWC2_45_44]HBR20540.1 hypothetical protein [Phycisphaerales bacterium]